jgi:hypothetical protein
VSSFKGAKQKLEQKLGVQAADSLVASSLFYICIGSNDYLVNWFALAPLASPLQLQYTPSQFVELLQTDLEQRFVVSILLRLFFFSTSHPVKYDGDTITSVRNTRN